MKKALFIMAVSAMAAGCADNSIPEAQLPELDMSNPLLAAWDTPHETPPFSEIKLSDYEDVYKRQPLPAGIRLRGLRNVIN